MDSITMTAEQQLPKGWKIERLGDVCSPPQYGFTTKAVENGTIRLLRTTDITNGKINWTDVPFCYENPDNIEKYLLQDGDIVISRAGSVGVSYLINNPPHSVFASYLIRFQPFINKKYFYFFLKSLAYWKQISESSVGIAVPNVNASKLKNILIPVAPQETQQAIVNKIESLFDEIDEGIGRLKTAAQQIQQYRQSLLKNAFNGELTKEWRSKHADTLPSEHELLAQIQTTREQHHAQQLADWQTAVSQWEQNGKEGKKPSKPILKKITTNISDNEIKIPDKYWFVGLFGDLVDIKSNLVKPDEYLDFPHIAPDNIEKNTGKLLSFKTIREDEVISPKHYFYAGQIIYSKIRPNLSKLVLVDFNGLCSADMYPLESDIFNHYFLKYIMLSRYFVKKASTAGSRSVLPKINQSELGMIPIPICSLAEQTQIVAILESKLTACDQLAAELAKQLKQAELLKQAVLKAAFSGSLLDK